MEDGELREEIGMKKHLKMTVIGSRLRWVGHIEKEWGGMYQESMKTEEHGHKKRLIKMEI